MKKFFRSKAFKIALALVIVCLGILIGSAISGRRLVFPTSAAETVVSPFQNLFSGLKNGLSGIGEYFTNQQMLLRENELLQQQLDALREQMVDYEEIKQENEQLHDILSITRQREDLKMVAATVTFSDGGEYYYSFSINRGSRDGLSLKDAVVTTSGVVGYISELGYNYAKVTTVLSPDTNIGGCDSTSHDYGVLTGSSELAAQGLFKLSYLPKDSLIAVGNIVITSGLGGVYPQGLIVGIVQRVTPDEQGVSLDAVLLPTADLSDLKEVLVITDFDPEAVTPGYDQTASTDSAVSETASQAASH